MTKGAPPPPRGRRISFKNIGAVRMKPDGTFFFMGTARNRKKTPTQRQVFSQQTMALAAYLAKTASPWEIQQAKEIAGTSGLTWRDVLIAHMFGTSIEITLQDGTFIQGRRILSRDINQLLDSISAVPGAMLVRTTDGWAVMYIGPDNYLMTVDPHTHMPAWLAPPTSGGGTGLPPFAGVPSTIDTHAGGASTGVGYSNLKPILVPQGMTINAIEFWARGDSPTTVLTPMLYDDAPYAPGALLSGGPTVTGAYNGYNRLELDTPYTAPAPRIVWPGILAQTATLYLANGPSANHAYTNAITLPLPDPAPSMSYSGWSGICWWCAK